MAIAFADIAFTPAVRAEQDRMGSGSYARFLSDDRQGGDRLGHEEAQFIEERDGFYQATVSETGWPYVQFRGGRPGFLKVVDPKRIAYADLLGNRQYLSAGNLLGEDRIALILMDYVAKRRLKLWGRARLIDTGDEPELVTWLADGADGVAERAVLIEIAAIDWNCPRHIPRRLTETEWTEETQALRRERDILARENKALRARLGAATGAKGT